MATYQYGGKTYELKDGLSNAEALVKIKASLGETTEPALVPTAAPVAAPASPSMLSQLGRQVGLTARAGITGAAAVPAAMADFLTGATGLATGQAIKPSSQALQEVLTQVGFPEPQTGLERAVQTGTSAMAGTGAQAAATQGVKALAPLSQDLLKQVAVSGGGGVAGQAAGETTAEITGSPVAGIAAGLATGVLGGSVAGKIAAKTGTLPKSPVTIQDIKNNASKSYQTVEQQGVSIKPKSVLDMLNNAENELVKNNFNPLLDTHKPVSQVLDQLRTMTGTQRVSFTKLEQMRSAANGLKVANEPATRKFAGELVTEIDKYISSLKGTDLIAGQGGLDKAVSSVQNARKDWRNMSKATILEDALNTAEARALDVKASENELIRRQLINLAANKKKMSQFSEVEQNAIKSVAKGGQTDPILSLIARFNPERSTLMQFGSLAGAFVNPVTTAVPVAGFAADKYLGAVRGKATRNLISDIAGGTLQPPLPSYSWRGMLSGMPQQEQQ